MKRDVFIETQNVSEFNRKINLLSSQEGEPGFALVYGQAGRGKTETARAFHAKRGGVYLRVMESWTQAAFLRALCWEVTGSRPNAAAACKERIIEVLDAKPLPIFVDEADRLQVGRVEDLRDIHDLTSAPIVLIGEQELKGLLSTRRRIWSRVKQVVEFAPVCDEDVAVLADEAAGLDVQADACAQIVRQTEGDFRPVWTTLTNLEQITRARETTTVDLAMATDALKAAMAWRK